MAETDVETAQMSWKKKLISAFVPLLAVLATVESVCRIFPYKDHNKTLSDNSLIPDPDLVYRLKPLAQFPKTNKLGLRDTEFNKEANLRILLLGDSVSYGFGIDDLKDCFPYLVETQLNRLENGPTHDVINTGVFGYATFQEAKYLELNRDFLKPNLVVLQFCLNDVVDPHTTLAQFGGDAFFFGIDTRKSLGGLYGSLYRRSRAFERLIRIRVAMSRNNSEYRVERMTVDSPSREIEEAWESTLVEIERIQELAREKSARLLIIIFPYRFQLANPSHLRQPQDRLIKFARSRQIAYVDLLPGFASMKNRDQLFFDESHLTELGHRITAGRLVKPIKAALNSNSE